MLPLYQTEQTSLDPLRHKAVAIIGYGNQGRPQALNLRDSGIDVIIGLRPSSPRCEQVLADGLTWQPIDQAVAQADVVMLLLPDHAISQVYQETVGPALKPNSYLGFCHGVSLLSGWIQPRADLNVFLTAPKAQGKGVRQKFLDGSGVPGLVAVVQDPSGDTLEIALAYGKGLGCDRVGMVLTTVEEETVTNLFAEQVVLCGGLSHLATTAFEVLVEAGFSPEIAYFECLHEIKLLANLLHEGGISGMRRQISPTACFGDITRGPKVIDGHVKDSMQRVLQQILDRRFMKELAQEAQAGYPQTQEVIQTQAFHLIEETGQRLRAIGLI